MGFKIIDLFAGVGGLSLGAARAGFEVAGAIEIDDQAISTHAVNFPNTLHLQKNINQLSANELLDSLNIKKGEIHGVIGGPPCQGFSTIGKRVIDDPRNDLFNDFFRLVSEIEPYFFVAENVTGILNNKYDEIRNNAFSHVNSNYHLLEPLKIKASDYGVPTIRTRVFFIGLHKSKFKSILCVSDFRSKKYQQITVKDALRGLPTKIDPQNIKEESSWHKVYKENFLNNEFFDKVSGQIPKNIGNFEVIEKYQKYDLVSGCHGTRHSVDVEKRYAALKYGQQDKTSKSVKLKPEGFCPTLRAGTGSDKGSYQAVRPIHFSEARVITPREAARLQGFPDWFIFHQTKWHSFRQIGNSVSPIVAEEILKVIYSALNK